MGIFNFFLLFVPLSLIADVFYIVDLAEHPNIGMFASANQVLGHLYLYENKVPKVVRLGLKDDPLYNYLQHKYLSNNLPKISGLKVDLGKRGLYYDELKGANWWNYYFEPMEVGTKENAEIRPPSRGESIRAFCERYHIARAEGAEIVKKYIRVRSEIQKKVDSFVQDYFQDFFIVGVHYRGTDKEQEAPKVEYENVFKSIEENIPLTLPYRIFVATDELPFLEAIQNRFPNQIICTDAHRTKGNTGVHYTFAAPPYQLGEEALMDCLLLSKSDLLIRTSSSLSLWSTYFNPDLPVILLNQRFVTTLEPE